jgi:surfactin synthase thioesterase subunit
MSIAGQDRANDNAARRLHRDDANLTVALGEEDRTSGERQEQEWKEEAHGRLTL